MKTEFFSLYLFMIYPASLFPLLEMFGLLTCRSLKVARGSTQWYMNRLHWNSLENIERKYKELQGYMLTTMQELIKSQYEQDVTMSFEGRERSAFPDCCI